MNATEQYRHECECREWLARIRAMRPRSEQQGKDMLKDLIANIAKNRGQAAADRLRAGIEAARHSQAGESGIMGLGVSL